MFACLIVSFKTVAPTVAKSTSVRLPKKVPIALRFAKQQYKLFSFVYLLSTLNRDLLYMLSLVLKIGDVNHLFIFSHVKNTLYILIRICV